jgi:four helix bundle protein
MGSVDQFEDLDVWQQAREMTNEIYDLSNSGEFSEDFELKSQIRRASLSILSNIAEGFERDGDKEFKQFLSTAKGSSGEVRAQLYICKDQKYISDDTFDELYEQTQEISSMINSLMSYLDESDLSGRKFKDETTSP